MRRRDFIVGGALAAGACVHAPDVAGSFSDVREYVAADGVRIAYRDSGQTGAPAAKGAMAASEIRTDTRRRRPRR